MSICFYTAGKYFIKSNNKGTRTKFIDDAVFIVDFEQVFAQWVLMNLNKFIPVIRIGQPG